ncbi:hypothetical protein TSOC_006571 [Tetrabaena socialis]|uniref:protein-serine/threonine phosphatase n=1 Tax=Tetrabaena socialis TaxID=47790 RepID=A0A2J8A3B1_9CHLO|nr:hypothetical protein TSOC_006571 [Tetrabaena socialis]|eukprot:PNH07012.1 hypothetical protein TSOC_006571 [Tetrabaena socialis]
MASTILEAYESSRTSLGEFAVLLKKTLAYPEQIAKDYIETIFKSLFKTTLGNEVPNEKQRFFHLESVAQEDAAFFIVKYTVASIFRRIRDRSSVPKTFSAKRLTWDFENNDDSLGDFAILLHQTQVSVDDDDIYDCAFTYASKYCCSQVYPRFPSDKERLFHGAFSCAVKFNMEDIFHDTLGTMKGHVKEDMAFVKAFDRVSCLLGDTIVRRIVSSADVRALITLKSTESPESTDITESCPICFDEDTGDSRAILFSIENGGTVYDLSRDHKPSDKSEEDRILRSDFTLHRRSGHDQFIVLATDGVWDVMSSNEVGFMIRYLGVQFAVRALTLCLNQINHDNRIITEQFHALYLFGHDEYIGNIAIDGLENQSWNSMRAVALHWLRIQSSARRIQAWWRRKLIARRMAMIRMTLIPYIVRSVPRS